jgi:hypothetical protein
MSSRQLRANRANAAASMGLKTKAGKARSAKNALRHGLNVLVATDPALAPQAEAIACKIIGSDMNPEALEWARRIGEAQVDLNRIRLLRRDAIARMLSDPHGEAPLRIMHVRLLGRFLERVERGMICPVDVETVDHALHPKFVDEDAKLAGILVATGGELARLDRYERRAFSRRKSAIRAYGAVRSSEQFDK